MKKGIACWIATCGPIGEIGTAPGSFGSLVAVPFVLLASDKPVLFFLILLAFVFVGIWSSTIAARDFGQQDPSKVVIDEVCGMMVSFLLIPINWKILVAGFIGFRFFDIVKPFPIRIFERFPSGFGIVLDDLAAGVFTNLLLHLLIRYAHL